MSQQVISQKIQRTCDGCGVVKEWELVNAGEKIIEEMQEWRTVVREVFMDGHFVKVMVQACSSTCLVPADAKIIITPKQEEPADNIDLSTLRTTNFAN